MGGLNKSVFIWITGRSPLGFKRAQSPVASWRQSGCSWWRIKRYKQSTRAPFDKIACLWSSRLLVESGFRAHQRKARLVVVYHAGEMPNQCFTLTADNNILKVKALNCLRWLCRQRDTPQPSKLWHLGKRGNTMKSWSTRMSHLCRFIFITSFHVMNKSCNNKQKKEKRFSKRRQHRGNRSETDWIVSFLSFFLPPPVVCVRVSSHITHMQVK